MAKAKKSIYTAFRIPPELRAQAEERAKDDGRTLSGYIKNLIREDLTEAGMLPERRKVSYSKARKKK